MLHIDLPTRAQIDQIAAFRGAPAVSIYLRTTPLTQDAQADRIELKNLLKAAVAEMEEAGASKSDVGAIEDGVTHLVEDDDFWVEQANSLAIFATPKGVKTFRLPNKLVNLVEVSDRFHIKPLIRSVTFPHEAYVLAIGINGVRLVEVSADLPPHKVSVPGLPKDFSHALGRRSHIEKDGEMRSGMGTSEHALLTRYARVVDQALRPLLAGSERPLIIAASEPLASIVPAVSSYPHVAAHAIPGSPDDVPDHVLADAARKILDEIYAGEIKALGELFAERAAHGRATNDIAQAARAATYGAVDTLLVDMDVTISGSVGEDDGAVTFDAEADGINYGVVDEVARRVLRSGGRVIAARRADIPNEGDLAAVLRYPI